MYFPLYFCYQRGNPVRILRKKYLFATPGKLSNPANFTDAAKLRVPPLDSEWGGMDSSGWRLISLIGKTKRITFVFGVTKKKKKNAICFGFFSLFFSFELLGIFLFDNVLTFLLLFIIIIIC